jgi:hypothetical protein
MRGRRSSPELVALTPVTTWRKTGRKTIAPNMVNPTMKPAPLATLKIESRNSRKGIIG